VEGETLRQSTPGRGFALHPAAMVWLLSQLIGYGTLYYSFAILAGDAAASVGWPVSWLFGSLSLGLFVGGLIAPEVGRRIDRHGAGSVMVLGSVLSALGLSTAAFAPNGTVLAASVVATQAASTMVQYEAAFAALVQAAGTDARRRIMHLTLIGGFASTIFWPLTAWLHGLFGWREIFLAFAAVNLFLAMPVHILLARHHHHTRRQPLASSQVADRQPPLPTTQRRLLWLVTMGFALAGFSLSAILAQMVPMLTALGLGASALIVSTLFGPAQVLVRFVNLLAGARRHPIVATLVALGVIPLGIAILAISAPWAAGAAFFAVLLGFGSGLKSIVQGTLPLALFGSGAYGARLGFMASVRQALGAIAPFALAFLIEHIGVTGALAIMTAVALAGLACMAVVARLRGTLFHES
jgi:MFS family permease